MEDCITDVDLPAGASAPSTADRQHFLTSSSDGKRVVKLSAKAIADQLDRLQTGRKAKLNKASSLKKKIQELMQKGLVSEIQTSIDGYIDLCVEMHA